MSVRALRAFPLASILAAILAVSLVGTATAYVVTTSEATPDDIDTSGTATVTLGITATALVETELVWLVDEGDSLDDPDLAWAQSNIQMLRNATASVGMNPPSVYARYSETVNYLGSNFSTVFSAPQVGGESHTGHAIEYVLHHLDPGSTPTMQYILVLMTDGNVGPGDTQSLLDVLATAPPNVVFLAIGRGEDPNLGNLELIAGQPEHLFLSASVDEPVDHWEFISVIESLLVAGSWWPWPGEKNVGATGIEVTATVASRFGAPAAVSADRGTATATGHVVTWQVDGLGNPSIPTESATLSYEVAVSCETGPGGLLDLHDSITYTDTQGRSLALGPVEVNLRGCAEALDLAPASADGSVGDEHAVTATVTDAFGDPVADVSCTDHPRW